jgi:hypothetical protein
MVESLQEVSVSMALKKFAGLEWYDNHRLDVIQSCHRKGFWHLVGPQVDSTTGKSIPLAMIVGQAASFGSVWHAGIAQYYANFRFPHETRIACAARGFELEWIKQFAKSELPNKYKLSRGLQQQVMYYDHFRTEDEFFQVVDSEIGFAILVRPRSHEMFDPFVYSGRIDRLLYRTTRHDYVVGETKTCSGDPVMRMKELRLDRQTRGYFKMTSMMMDEPVSGVLPDVVQITATKCDASIFARDYFPLTVNDGESWRRQTINIVQMWRGLLAQAERLSADKVNGGNQAVLDVFDQRTKECSTYGICPYYELCQYGPTADSLSKYSPDTWNPLVEPVQTLRVGEV